MFSHRKSHHSRSRSLDLLEESQTFDVSLLVLGVISEDDVSDAVEISSLKSQRLY